MRRSIERGVPSHLKGWQKQTALRLSLGANLLPRGGPHKCRTGEWHRLPTRFVNAPICDTREPATAGESDA